MKKNAVPEVSRGIKGAIKERIIRDMVESVPGNMKIVVVDSVGAEILNSCMRMNDLMDHGVTLIEDIKTIRQPIPSSPVIYFVAPNADNVRRIIQDWATKDVYSEAHIFFVSVAPDALLRDLAPSRLAQVKKLKTLKDLLISFQAPETLAFHLNEKNDLPTFYGALAAVAGSRDKKMNMANQLAAVMHTLGDYPVLRFQNTPVAKEFAATVQESCDLLNQHARASDPSSAGNLQRGTSLLLIVDRSIDVAAPLVHDLYYQAMLEDLMPLTDNIYEQIYKDRSGKDSSRKFIIDEGDPHWCKYRHEHFSQCLSKIPGALQELLKANPQLANGMEKGAKLADLGAAVRALPQFQETQAKLSMHIDIIDKLFTTYKAQKLDQVADLEQKIVNAEDSKGKKASFKDIFEDLRKLAKDINVRMNDKLRLVLLAATLLKKDFTADKRKQVLEECGFTADDPTVKAAELLFVAGAPGALAAGSGAPKGFKADLVGTFYTHLKTIMEQAVGDTLSPTDFPFSRPGDAAKIAQAATASSSAASAAGGTSRSLRSATLTRSKAGAGVTDKVLDLGHGDTVPLSPGARVVVFVIGGCSRGEMRAAYTVARTTHREVIIGGTSLQNPNSFVQQLPLLV